jgi:hypothetical protein
LVTVTTVLTVARVIRASGDGDDWSGVGPQAMSPIFEALELSEAQRQAWLEACWAAIESLQPALDEVRDLRAELRSELDKEAPEAAIAGGYVIAIRERVVMIDAARRRFDASVAAILDEDQRAQYEAFKARPASRVTKLTNTFPAPDH